jgi:hypothetical protein
MMTGDFTAVRGCGALCGINRAAYVFVKISAAYAAPGNLNL